MHEQIAASFFRKCKEYCQETGDEEALAYVFGFICHYMLDSTCHPYIAKYMEKTGARHDEIETELDRYLMERSGKNPFRFKPAAQLKASKESVRAVSAQTAFYAEKKAVPIRETKGMICSEFVMCYPPGIPILAPGERITAEILDYIEYAKAKGCNMTGPEDPDILRLNVLTGR